MKLLKSILAAAVVLSAVTGCFSHKKETVIERERPVSSGSTTVVTPDSTIKVK